MTKEEPHLIPPVRSTVRRDLINHTRFSHWGQRFILRHEMSIYLGYFFAALIFKTDVKYIYDKFLLQKCPTNPRIDKAVFEI